MKSSAIMHPISRVFLHILLPYSYTTLAQIKEHRGHPHYAIPSHRPSRTLYFGSYLFELFFVPLSTSCRPLKSKIRPQKSSSM
jgi:hypothetical protein